MAIATAHVQAGDSIGGALVLENVSWETYEMLLRDLDGQHLSLTYDEGSLSIVSPLQKHERDKKLVGRMIELCTLERDIPIMGLGSTTWRKKALRKGLEPDACYYVQREPQVRGRTDIDLKNDPPPDLAIEAALSRHPVKKLPIYAALGVPEVWVCEDRRIVVLHLERGAYVQRERSAAFPSLKPSDLEPFLARSSDVDETTLMRQFRDWVRSLPA